MNEQYFKRVISGDAHGLIAGCLRCVLLVLSWPYACAMWWRNRSFDIKLRTPVSVKSPVIAVGNLTTGGTGKTPVVAWIVQQLQAMDHRPGIVSRGYGADDTGVNDEKRVLQIVCPGVPHEQNPDRIAAAHRLCESAPVSVIVCDDAFQHRRIHRDLNIVLIDATNPFGYGHLLPRGLLREPINSLSRADLVLITRADLVSDEALQAIESQIVTANPKLHSRTFPVCFKPCTLIDSSGSQQSLDAVADQNVTVMSGIGNPDAFLETCRLINTRVTAKKIFPDHHLYTDEDLNSVQHLAAESGTSLILTTLKDLVKISGRHHNIRAIHIETVFRSDNDQKIVRELLKNIRHTASDAERETA